MSCDICGQKPMNCDCTETERRQYGEIEELQDEIASLREAIRRLADQDATLSVCDGNVTVTMDATLAEAEREAIKDACRSVKMVGTEKCYNTLRGLLERLGAANGGDDRRSVGGE